MIYSNINGRIWNLFLKLPSSYDVRKWPERARGPRALSATREILIFGFLSVKELFYMPKSDLLEYKWANLESFFETPKSVQRTEMAGTLIACSSRALSVRAGKCARLARTFRSSRKVVFA